MGYKPRVWYNLKISPFTVQTESIKFFFSSEFYANKFADMLKSNRDSFNQKISSRYDIPVRLNNLADLTLYKRIEIRGCYYEYQKEGFECLDTGILINDYITVQSNN